MVRLTDTIMIIVKLIQLSHLQGLSCYNVEDNLSGWQVQSNSYAYVVMPTGTVSSYLQVFTCTCILLWVVSLAAGRVVRLTGDQVMASTIIIIVVKLTATWLQGSTV